ncbi:MAG: DUF4349 domain-containing protein [Bacteroidota bacterium]
MRSFILLIALSLFIGCASSPQYAAMPRKTYRTDGQNERNKKDNTPVDKRVIIYNAYVSLKVKNSDSANAALKAIAEKNGGYAMSLGDERAEIRVKAELLNDALLALHTVGKVTSKTVSGRDVTDEFYDTQIRLDNAKKARQRYLELLQKAENVETTLKVEKELERLNGEIDSFEGQINRLEHLSAYSTLTIRLKEKEKLGILGYVFVGAYKGIAWLFVR